VDKGRPPLRATSRIMIRVVDLPSTSANVPYFVSNFTAAPVRLMENDVVGHMVCIVAASDADGDKLWYYITGESIAVFSDVCVSIVQRFDSSKIYTATCICTKLNPHKCHYPNFNPNPNYTLD